jgi:hypothetical protein
MSHQPHEQIYSHLRADVLARHFALGKFWRVNHFTNVNLLGEMGDCFLPGPTKKTTRPCFTRACLPRRSGHPVYETPDAAGKVMTNISAQERWRVWNHDRTNPLLMTGLRLIHLTVEHRLGHPLARQVIKLILNTTAALFKYPEDSDYDGYILRWDPVADDDWELEIDDKGIVTPTVPCRFLLNSDLKNFAQQRYLYCTPLDDPRYLRAVKDGIAKGQMGGGQDRFRRWEPSKDEYVGILAGFSLIFDAFSNSTVAIDQEIVAAVRSQTRRIAKYLQRCGYLLVRPCGGVTARGCGEILPLLEFPFNRVFQRILGDSFESNVSYTDALNRAGIRPRELVGTSALSVGQLTIEAIKGVRKFLVDDHHAPTWLEGDKILNSLDATQSKKLAELWASRKMIDAVDVEMQGEVLMGFLANSLNREARRKVFEKWLARNGREISDAFKPYIALMVLNDDDDFVRRNYITWYESTFNPPPAPSLVSDGNDWALAGAVAMLVAQRQGDTARHARFAVTVERQLTDMADELLHLDPTSPGNLNLIAVSGAGAAPSNDQEMEDKDGMSCGAGAPRFLASEYHDKNGDWYGYMPTLALVWRHLLDGVTNPFSADSGLRLPTGDSLTHWPVPFVPAAVIAEARTVPQRMLVPTSALSLATPNPNGLQDVLLFVDPPPRPSDNNLGRRPNPKGETRSFEFSGGLLRKTQTQDFNYPSLGETSPESDFWSQAPSFNLTEQSLVEHWESRIEDGHLHLEVTLRAAQIEWISGRFGVRHPRLNFAKLAGTVSLAWVRQR